MSGLRCTNCFRDTGVEPDWSDMPTEVVVALAVNWRCNDCLDQSPTPEEQHSPMTGAEN